MRNELDEFYSVIENIRKEHVNNKVQDVKDKRRWLENLGFDDEEIEKKLSQ